MKNREEKIEKRSLSDLWEISSILINICVTGVSGNEIEIEAENTLKKIIMKNINLNIQKSQQTLSR